MAIQIRRGSNATWEANKSNIVVGEPAVTTDTKRAFIGTSTGHYMELANIESVAPAFNESTTYNAGDVVTYRGLMWVAIAESSGVFNSANWEQMSIGNMLSQFNEHLYDGYEKNTIENVDIASFDNGAGGIPVVDLSVGIEATQDLHGYSHPWAGGAGKNLLPLTVAGIKGANTDVTWNGNACTVSGVTFTIQTDNNGNVTGVNANGTATADASIYLTRNASITGGILNGCPSGGSQSTYYINSRIDGSWSGIDTGSGRTFTGTLDRAIVTVINGYTANNVLFKPMIRLASVSDATWEPYSNICPIDGYDEVVVNVAGKNLYIGSPSFDGYVDRSYYTLSSETYNGHEVIQKTSTWYGAYKEVPVLAGKTYTFSAMVKVSSSVNVYIYDVDNARLASQYVSANTWTRVQATFTASKSRLEHLRVEIGSANTTVYLSEYQLELGSTATEYEPYNGNTYTTAVNVWDEVWEQGGISTADGQNTSTAGYYRSTNYIPVLPNTKYYFKFPVLMQVLEYGSSKNYLRNANPQNEVFTIPSDVYYIRFRNSSANTWTPYNHDISINYPSNNTNYIPYKGSTATQNYMDTFGHGVYGGTLDVTTGVLTVTHGFKLLGELTWDRGNAASGHWRFIASFAQIKLGESSTSVPPLICSQYDAVSLDDTWVGKRGVTSNIGNHAVIINDELYSDATSFKNALTANNAQLVYELATPQTVQLTPTEVETVYKNNNVWANSGKIKVLVYRMTRN